MGKSLLPAALILYTGSLLAQPADPLDFTLTLEQISL